MRAPAMTGGATAFASAALADELPLILAETSEAFVSASAVPRARARALRRLVGVLQSLVRLQGGIAIDMAALLLELHEHRAWDLLGYSGLESYVENRLGLGGSMARQQVSLARELRRYRHVSTAYEGRVIGFVATQWVTRTLRPTRGELALQAHWVRHAKERTVKRLRDESRGLDCSGSRLRWQWQRR